MTAEQLKTLKDNLWAAAIKLRADSDLKLNEFSTPVLGLIFLKFADNKYKRVEAEIQAELESQQNSRRQRPEHEIAIEQCGFYLPKHARYVYLLDLPEEEDIDKALKTAMGAIEQYKPELKDTLPQDEYFRLTRNDRQLPKTLLKLFQDIPEDASGDVFGQIYEFFLGKFAMYEGQGGGEFFTPASVVKYMVEVIEPYRGAIFDPACGSGGMFVQSSNFVDRRKKELHDTDTKDLFVYGVEKTLDTVKLAKMNLAVHGLPGRILQANSYYEDPFDAFGHFDFVMANPPFNVRDVNAERVKGDKRFNTYGVPQNKSKSSAKKKEADTVPNANYLWINLFATSLKPNGRAALVMANSASDARHSEYDIRKTLVRHGLISQMVTLPSNMFTTVTLPASLWFFDKSKLVEDFEVDKNKIRVLFIDARNHYRQLTRAHREFTDEQLFNLATITRLHRGERHRFVELVHKYVEAGRKELEQLPAIIERATAILNEKEAAMKQWQKQYLFSEEEKAKAEEFGLAKLLESLEPADPKLLVEICKRLFQDTQEYLAEAMLSEVDAANKQQHRLGETYTQFLEKAQKNRKQMEKHYRQMEKLRRWVEKELPVKKDGAWALVPDLKETRQALDELGEAFSTVQPLEPRFVPKSALYFMKQVCWLQERFPDAAYEDVTGLCKSAGIEEIEEQDYSLNPGRYVGVVIEEDGMTEDEFEDMMVKNHEKLMNLEFEANEIRKMITKNFLELFEDVEIH